MIVLLDGLLKRDDLNEQQTSHVVSTHGAGMA